MRPFVLLSSVAVVLGFVTSRWREVDDMLLAYIGNVLTVLGIVVLIVGFVGKATKRLDSRRYRSVWRTGLLLLVIGMIAGGAVQGAIQGWREGWKR